MKSTLAAAALALSATVASAQEREFVCVSDLDGTEYRLKRTGADNTGTVAFNDLEGEAQVFPGLNNLTFIVANEQHVMTFFVKQPGLTYSLSVRRPSLRNDRGQCSEVQT